ncbi:MAG: SAM-dependent methyltransferase [bacterium]|jgi:23S rRNA (cytidine1920-2'-O)/16S rRNA (cytidine1409-2'-O)-methyltransferase
MADLEYVGRGGLKIQSVANKLGLNFRDKIVLDVGSSTGGFTDFALQHGALKVIAVDLGVMQLHKSLRINPKVEIHEKTDILSVKELSGEPDIILMDLSFVSLRNILPGMLNIIPKKAEMAVLVKPQFEASRDEKIKGIIKNDRIRRQILKDFESWASKYFIILDKADSEIHGSKGNSERFYLLKKVS